MSKAVQPVNDERATRHARLTLAAWPIVALLAIVTSTWSGREPYPALTLPDFHGTRDNGGWVPIEIYSLAFRGEPNEPFVEFPLSRAMPDVPAARRIPLLQSKFRLTRDDRIWPGAQNATVRPHYGETQAWLAGIGRPLIGREPHDAQIRVEHREVVPQWNDEPRVMRQMLLGIRVPLQPLLDEPPAGATP